MGTVKEICIWCGKKYPRKNSEVGYCNKCKWVFTLKELLVAFSCCVLLATVVLGIWGFPLGLISIFAISILPTIVTMEFLSIRNMRRIEGIKEAVFEKVGIMVQSWFFVIGIIIVAYYLLKSSERIIFGSMEILRLGIVPITLIGAAIFIFIGWAWINARLRNWNISRINKRMKRGKKK